MILMDEPLGWIADLHHVWTGIPWRKTRASPNAPRVIARSCSESMILPKPVESLPSTTAKKPKKNSPEWNKQRRERRREYYRAVDRAKHSRRRAAQLLRSPVWADVKAIREFYRCCPAGYVVDHVVPLQGKGVCGLHVLENLQYLPAAENIRKGNKWPED